MSEDKPKAEVKLPSYGVAKKAKAMGMPRSFLIYGLPKRGKSVMAGSIMDVPGIERVLMIDVEGGSASLADWYPEVDVITTPTAAMFNAVVQDLLNNKLMHESGLPYQVVIIDTIDKAQARQLIVYGDDPRSAKDGFWKWAMIKAWTEKVTDHLHMAPFMTIFVAHQDEDKETGQTTVLMDGKSRLTFPSTPDIIGHFNIVKVDEGGKKVMRRQIDFSMNDRLITGQRYADKLNGKFLDPDMEMIFRKIQPDLFKSKAVSK